MEPPKTKHLKKVINAFFQPFSAFFYLFPKEIVVFILLTAMSLFVLVSDVSLVPKVDNNFFFSSDDPQFQSEHLMDRLFVRRDSQLIIAVKGKIGKEKYREKIAQLSEVLTGQEGISSVISLTHAGPGTLRKAFNSPLWKRLIISADHKSTNLIVLIDEGRSSELIPRIEEILAAYQEQDFQLRIAGLPYVVELIRRLLLRDLRIFSLLAFFIFGFLIYQIFRSKMILLGTIVSCLNSCMWTFMITHLLGIPMGLLTANLGTIIFVMTLSHIVFLTFNWRRLQNESQNHDPVKDAVHLTFPPSFWSMLTTFFGFLSLLAVSAKPLRDLGASGAIGAVISIVVAYTVFPAFLRATSRRERKRGRIEQYERKTYRFIDLEKQFVMLIIFVTCLLTLPGLAMLDSDPSLLSYFSPSSEIHKGLSYIDRCGGSSPLLIAVRSDDNQKISSDQSYKRLWSLQESLEQHRSVGSVISLPVLIAQARGTPVLGWILPREVLLSAMEMPMNDNIAESFVTKDRKYGLFLLRMIESYRSVPRLAIVEELEAIVKNAGLYPEIVGGVYKLQGHLAKMVFSSLVSGLAKLILLFGGIALYLSRSFKVTLSVIAGIFVIPLTVLGCFGIYRIPLDIISAPASNVAIAMGIDSMIHMIKSYRRNNDWQAVRDELWQPVLTSMFVVAIGFAIFLFSSFPPTRRFGGAIVLGTVLAALTALYIMPLLYEKISAVMDKRSKT